jgi:hypothetical protein
MLSKQTPNKPSFPYNPFTGADVLFFPTDRDAKNPRRFILRTNPAEPGEAIAAGGRIVIKLNAARQPIAFVNGKQTERFSIVYPGKRQRKTFGSV